MSKSEFLDYILELLSDQEAISARAMFGGYGLYKHGQIFALIIQDELYFKVNDNNKDYFINAGCSAFSYERKGKKYYMSYYNAPSEIYDDPHLLNSLVEGSYEISLNTSPPPGKNKIAKN